MCWQTRLEIHWLCAIHVASVGFISIRSDTTFRLRTIQWVRSRCTILQLIFYTNKPKKKSPQYFISCEFNWSGILEATSSCLQLICTVHKFAFYWRNNRFSVERRWNLTFKMLSCDFFAVFWHWNEMNAKI